MKEKGSKFNPVQNGMTVLLASGVIVCAALVMTHSVLIGSILLVCAVGIIAEKMMWTISRKKKMKEYLANVPGGDEVENNEALFKTLNPIAGLRIDGTVAWYNSSFKELFPAIGGKKICELVPEIKIREIYDEGGKKPIIAAVGSETYSITAVVKRKTDPDHAAIMIYMEKVTELIQARTALENEKNVVAEINVDNYDEALENVNDEQRIDIITLLDKNVIGWAQDCGGLVKKLEKDKFLCVFTKKQLDEFIENKFSLLTDIKEADHDMKTPLTLSVGIGTGGESLYDNDISAKKALEMALGRGGDQVVIRENGRFRYFGGNSKETEKRTKVKARMMSHNLRELMESADNVLIMGHKNSDTDVVGAAIGIASMAAFIGKDAKILLLTKDDTVNLLLKKIEDNHYHDGLFIGKIGLRDFLMPKTLLVICDTHRPEYTEMPELLETVKAKVVIDHHRRSESFISDADLIYHEPFASSTCEMVAELMQYFDPRYSVSTVDAEALYSGIAMDTKNFMFKTGVRTFEAAAYLRNAGVDTLRVKRLFRESIENYKLKACIVTEAQVYGDNIAISLFSGVVPHLTVAAAADEMLEITDIKAAFVVARVENGSIIISGRSLGDVNVQVILEKLGGGGHMMVAGAQLEGISVADAGDKLKAAIDECLKN